jgi:hypothetical protein
MAVSGQDHNFTSFSPMEIRWILGVGRSGHSGGEEKYSQRPTNIARVDGLTLGQRLAVQKFFVDFLSHFVILPFLNLSSQLTK